ncbi:MAG: TMEM165/GDT1 family protein [Leptolyngbya sp. SIOISBB]|nr:TMEM165/GDT1 family protein [Leptolyngbya sp. SIOISBB]
MSVLTGFTAGLLLITLSELGDKTFFIGALLAMRHPRRWVFVGVTAALFAMTVLSVFIGQVAALLPLQMVKWVAASLFIGCGVKLLYDAALMDSNGYLGDEQAAASDAIHNHSPGLSSFGLVPAFAQRLGTRIAARAFTLTLVAEWGDRTQLATITLAVTHHPVGVVLGATLGHSICAAIAVLCGKFCAGKLSERWLTGLSGALFVLFGAIAAFDAL